MSKKIQMDDEEGGSDWLATYGDMVTLLLAFFVLLFAISTIDAMKFDLLAAAMSADGLTAERFQEILEKHGQIVGTGDVDPNNPKFPGPGSETPAPEESSSGESEGNPALDELHEQLKSYIIDKRLDDVINLRYDGDYLMLTLTNDVWFAPGSDEISAAMQEHGKFLAQVLSDNFNPDDPFHILVAGHTDNVPQSSLKHPNNWYLSVHRAVKFTGLLIEESGIRANAFSAGGSGEEDPVDTNDTDEGRQRNRRVEVLISQPKSRAAQPEWASDTPASE